MSERKSDVEVVVQEGDDEGKVEENNIYIPATGLGRKQGNILGYALLLSKSIEDAIDSLLTIILLMQCRAETIGTPKPTYAAPHYSVQ